MIKTIQSSLIVAVALVICVPAHAVSMRINTPEVELALQPGESKTGTLGCDNPTDKDMIIRVYAEDWSYKPTGGGDKDFFPAATIEKSAAKWIALNAVEFTLPPYGHRDVNYTLTVPKEGVSGTYHAVVFFETTAGTATTAEGATVLVAARLGTIFRVEIAGTTRREGQVSDVKITPPSGSKPAQIVTTFKNTGNTDIAAKGNLLILDSQGLVKGRGNLDDIMTESGQEVTRTSEWAGKLGPGEYDVIFTWDLGEGQLITAERKMIVEATPG